LCGRRAEDPSTLRLGDASAPRSLLHGAPDGSAASELGRDGIGPQTLSRLAALGLVSFSRRRVERDPFDLSGPRAAPLAPVVLTDEQSAAFNRLATLAGAGGFHPVVLHGVTGSGKTEIYLRLAGPCASRAAACSCSCRRSR
jgi:primosomal protein N' (replication factor Y)